MQTMMIRRPFDPFSTARRLDAALADVVGAWTHDLNGSGAAWVPSVDVSETEQGLVITAELPGIDPSAVKLTVEQNVLTLSGEKTKATVTDAAKAHRRERVTGKFARSFTLPATVDAARIEATAAHGVLTITLPRAEQAKPREIAIRTGA